MSPARAELAKALNDGIRGGGKIGSSL